MRGAWLVPIALCLGLLGCSNQASAPSDAASSQLDPAEATIGSWAAVTTMTVSGASIPTSTTATFKQDGTLTITASTPVLGEIFNQGGTWTLSGDGTAVVAKIASATTQVTPRGDKLLWLNIVWSKTAAPDSGTNTQSNPHSGL